MADLSVSLQHDTYCVAVLSNPAIADPFIRHMLEPEMAAELADGPPMSVPTNVAGADLSRGIFDLAYLYRLKSGGWLKIVFEHKSSQDRRTPAQMARYIALALESPDPPGEALEMVLPVVLYHGRKRDWTLRCAKESFRTRGRLRELFGFFYLLWNLMKLDLDSLPLPRLVWAVVATMVGAFRNAAGQARLLDPIILALPDGELIERQTLLYIANAWRMDHAELDARVKTLKPERAKEDIMGTVLEEMAASSKAEGLAEGLAAGKAEGLAAGKAETLLKQLRLKFRRLPAEVQARVSAASAAQLDAWLEAVLYAESLDDVFSA